MADAEDYESVRARQIASNKALLAQLGLDKPVIPKPPQAPPKQPKASTSASASASTSHKRKRDSSPPTTSLEPRRSSRLRNAPALLSTPSIDFDRPLSKQVRLIRQLSPAAVPPASEDPSLETTYGAPPPVRDTSDGNGTLRFEDAPGFEPNVTPSEMMRKGVFGGAYFRRRYSSVLRAETEPDYDEFPKEWYEGLKPRESLCGEKYNFERNRYKVKASQSIEDWEKQGWIVRQDPRGWFQWYCRFYAGRRSPDDTRQINRFNNAVGPRGRFKTSLVRKAAKSFMRADALEDDRFEPVLKQTLLHWAVQLTRAEYARYTD